MKHECIEILLASYNGAKYIQEQIDSILYQTDDHWHLTVSDDGSTDSTVDILDDYVRRYPDKITRVYSGRKFGNARDHFFWLVGQCQADMMMTCDQDDRWRCEKVQRFRSEFQKLKAEHGKDMPLLVFSDQTPTDAQGYPLASSLMRYQNQFFGYFDYRSLLMQNVVTGGAMGFNRALAILAMQHVDTSKAIMHDWWLAIVAAKFGKIVYIDQSLGDYRQHEGNVVGAKNVATLSYVRYMLTRMDIVRKSIARKKAQAKLFSEVYQAHFTQSDHRFLNGFVRPRSGMLFYVRYHNLIHGIFRFLGMMVLG